ncbi:MAG: serine/threonine protein kinase [Polyangiaceae bacterium]|nr:serine/threonine protein kinase [Polyangiaceae bacterium]
MHALTELKAGRFLGRYELLMPVAQGGMASVWAARLVGTRGFQKVVAIKTILPTLSEDARFEQMFLDEAALAARIRHPNVVQVLDLGEEDGLLYQVMEWIEGEPLSTFMRELPEGHSIPFGIAAKIMIGVCDGLHAAHETKDDTGMTVGLVHRDMSPQNILVTSDGAPKVVDFGVAKASSLSSVQTFTGTLKGKPAYMAPEQILGVDIDRRADVFSIGVLLYVLTTRKHPFRGSNDVATLHNVSKRAPAERPSHHRESYPPELEAVVMMAIDKARDNRFATAAAVARALEAAVPDAHKVGDAEVAAFMRALLGPRLEKRAKLLRASLNEADLRGSSPSAMAQLARNPSTFQVMPLIPLPGALPSHQLNTPAIEGNATPIPPRKSRRLVAALALVTVVSLCAAAAGVLFPVLRPGTDAAVHDAATAAEPAAATGEGTRPGATTAEHDDQPVNASSADAALDAEEPEITAEALPAVSEAPDSPPRAPAEARNRGRGPREPMPREPALGQSASPLSNTAPKPGVRGTVPTIRDPGF